MRLIFTSVSLWVIFSFGFLQNSFAVLHELFDSSGHQVDGYDKIIEDLENQGDHLPPHTQLKFSDGKVFEVVGLLGRGWLTAVFKTKDGLALRVPLRSGVYKTTDENGVVSCHKPYTDYMNQFMDGYKEIEHIGAQVGVFPEFTHTPEYIAVELFPTLFNLEDFYRDRDRLIQEGKLDPHLISKLEESFIQLAVGFAEFKDMYDFRDVQIGSDGKTWKILDIGASVKRAQKVDDPTLFDKDKFDYRHALPDPIRNKIIEQIKYVRLHKLKLLPGGAKNETR